MVKLKHTTIGPQCLVLEKSEKLQTPCPGGISSEFGITKNEECLEIYHSNFWNMLIYKNPKFVLLVTPLTQGLLITHPSLVDSRHDFQQIVLQNLP